MANFQVQVEAITGLTIAGTGQPTAASLTEYLRSGVLDVTNKSILIRPQDMILFQAVSPEQTSNASYTVKGQIIEVLREANVNNDWRSCSLIPPSLQSRVTDTTSIHYTSKYNPSYFVGDNGKISVFPAPGADPNSFKVHYLNNEPKRDSDAGTLAYDSSDIRFFPRDRVHLVVIYAGIKSLEFTLAGKAIPTVSGDGGGVVELTDVSILDGDNTIDVRADQGEVDQWWSTVGHLVEDEEDAELGSIQVQKISTYLQAYQTQLAGNKTEYEWMAMRLQFLKQEYMASFGTASQEKQTRRK